MGLIRHFWVAQLRSAVRRTGCALIRCVAASTNRPERYIIKKRSIKLLYALKMMLMPVLNFSNPAAAQPNAHLPVPQPAAVLALHAKAGEAAALLKALANPDRLLLLCQLVGAERTVTQLGDLAGVQQPSLSQQLAVLRGERLVATRREGKNIFYRLASPAATAVLQTLYGLFCQPLADAAAAGAAPVLATASAAAPLPRRRTVRPAQGLA